MTFVALGLFVLAPLQGNAQAGSVWDKLKIDAEGRLRGEATLENIDTATGNSVDDRYRGRMRFRLGAKYPLADKMTLGARLSTASDGNDANNPHWDWGDGDGFNSTQVVMDRYFIDWKQSDELDVLFGKQPNAFAQPPIFGDFLWDSDISPAGIAAVWKPEQTKDTTFDARAAAWIAAENAADHDAKMLGAQGNVYVPLDEGKLQLSTALFNWTNIGSLAGAPAGTNQGNNTTNFCIWETFAAGTIPGGPMDEMTGYVQYLTNIEEGDDGLVLAGQLGSSKWERGNYNAFLEFYDLDGNATYSPVAQDDTPVPGTGLNDGQGDGQHGWVLGGQYFWRDNVAFKLWVLTSNADGAEDDPIRIRLDMDFKVK